REHDAGERRQRIERGRDVLRHLAGREQLGDQRGGREQERRPAERGRPLAHGPTSTRFTASASTKMSPYATITMSATRRPGKVRNSNRPFRRSTIWPMVMKARSAPVVNVAANARATNASASEQMESSVATGMRVATDPIRLPPSASRSPRGTN